eukprot:TRINITY_DN28862_c0_g1_i1.p1 TRINITY_DN28862_c0_g1~~TRINITY_DN28862_c0_g1_i1.p1  ORF type:complete len:360 (-),score=74.06 TRINITY_DN28862_c0_g1_i1:25-1104(-)
MELKHLVGAGMLIGCLVLWVCSSVAVQVIAGQGANFKQPLFVTFLNSGMGITLLWPHAARWLTAKGQHLGKAGLSSTASLSATIGMLWLLSSCLYNFSLLQTSVATNTVLSSTSSVFTFMFALIILRSPFRFVALGAAVLSFSGCFVVAKQVPQDLVPKAIHTTQLGDALTLASAALFSLSSVLLQKFAPSDFDTSSFMGLNAVLSLTLAPPVLYVADALGCEAFRLPDLRVLCQLAANALFGCVFANYLYTSALLRLSPLLANAGLSLSIPISALVDEVLLGQHQFSTAWGLGAALASAGVVLAAFDLEAASVSEDMGKAHPEELQPLVRSQSGGGEDDDELSSAMIRRPASSRSRPE